MSVDDRGQIAVFLLVYCVGLLVLRTCSCSVWLVVMPAGGCLLVSILVVRMFEDASDFSDNGSGEGRKKSRYLHEMQRLLG